MADVSPAPTVSITNLTGPNSAWPAEGAGLIHHLLDPSHPGLIKRGRVEDVFMDAGCAVVAVYGYNKGVPMFWCSGAMNRWYGAKLIQPPTVGTEVLCWLPPDGKYGIIVGATNAPGDGSPKPVTSLFNTPVDRSSPNEIHTSGAWGMAGTLIQAANGIHTDVLPGDSVLVNEMGVMSAICKLLAVQRGGDGAKLETFLIDELYRITAANLQIRTSMGERNALQDFGYIDDEESGSHDFGEAMGKGAPKPKAALQPGDPGFAAAQAGITAPDTGATPAAGRETLRRRFHNFCGYLGGLFQRFVIRPQNVSGDLDKADQPDMGMSQQLRTFAGWEVTRSVVGGGIHKSLAIAVPKRSHEQDDPAGDATAPKFQPREAFQWQQDPQTPAAIYCQLRDFFAWNYNAKIPQRFTEKSGDWEMGDEADCPVPLGADQYKAPGIGGFYREFPGEQAAMSTSSGGDFSDDSGLDGFAASPGEAWMHCFPDGSVSIRDGWASGIEMRGGHVDITASKDIRLFAGGTVLIMGGDDVIIKAQNSIDITSSKGQVRLKSQAEMFIHAEKGGMLISLGTVGQQFENKPGEQRHMPGLCIKVPDGGGFLVDAGQATFNLEYRLFLNRNSSNSQDDNSYPDFVTHSANHYHWMEDGGMLMRYQDPDGSGDHYNYLYRGNMYATDAIVVEGAIDAKGHIWSGDSLAGSPVNDKTDWKDVPPMRINLSQAFQDTLWQTYQFPYSLDDLQNVAFLYRTVGDYATLDGKWFETFWQRETPDLGDWEEQAAPYDSSYPYPGQDFYRTKKEFWTYREQNVQSNGRAVSRAGQNKSAGHFTATTWQHLPVHPIR